MLDTERQALERLTSTGNNASPIWSPDGNRIAFTSDRAGCLVYRRGPVLPDVYKLVWVERDGHRRIYGEDVVGLAIFVGGREQLRLARRNGRGSPVAPECRGSRRHQLPLSQTS
ncbi:MAG: hypothetical protein E2P02_10970 [Acidobacteria bacterium]|nr:MAG: hypothetical protein E2P02_10970 [Acidobacteriota bacterium]